MAVASNKFVSLIVADDAEESPTSGAFSFSYTEEEEDEEEEDDDMGG